jgi:hypothetical protein
VNVRNGWNADIPPLSFGVLKRAKRFLLPLTTLLPLTGCGQYLGAYEVEDVRLVSEIPPSHFGSPSRSYGRYLEVRLASKTSLTSIRRKVDAVYVEADFCSQRNRNGLIAFGPYSKDENDLSLPGDATALKAERDGLFRYRLYVVVAHRAQRTTEPGQLQLPTYNLKGSSRDLCLRLFAPGYNLIQSRSETIRVPAEMVASAIKEASARPPS